MRPEEKWPWHETWIKKRKNVMSYKPQQRKHFKERTINPCQTFQRLFTGKGNREMDDEARQVWRSRESSSRSYLKVAPSRVCPYIVGKDPVEKDMFIEFKFACIFNY